MWCGSDHAQVALQPPRQSLKVGEGLLAEAAVVAASSQVERAKPRVEEAAKKVDEQKKAESAAAEASKAAETVLTAARRDHDFATNQVARANEALPQRQAELAATEQTLADTQARRGQLDESLKASQLPLLAVAFAPDGSQLSCLDAEGGVVVCGGGDGLAAGGRARGRRVSPGRRRHHEGAEVWPIAGLVGANHEGHVAPPTPPEGHCRQYS